MSKKYILSNNYLGGTQKYVKDILENYPKTERIHTYQELISKNLTANDTIFLQHFLSTEISPEQFVELKERVNFKIIITLHDFGWLLNYTHHTSEFHTIYLNEQISICPNIKKLFDLSDLIIAPSEFVFNVYKKHFNPKNIIFNPHNDYYIDENAKNCPLIKNNTINIASLRSVSEIKGLEAIEFLGKFYKTYKGYNITICSCGLNIPTYEENQFFNFINDYNINGLLHLNRYGETYDYSLTKSINSGLPIFYNNIGSNKTRILNKEHYIKATDDETQYHNHELLIQNFNKYLDYIIENNGKYNNVHLTFDLKCNALYNFLFA